MASQTGSIDLTASNGVKLMAEAGFENIEENYATKAELDVQADRIGMVVANNDASSSLQLTADAMTYIGNNVTIKGTDGTTTAISGGRIQANSLSIGAFDSAAQSATLNSNISVGGRNLLTDSESMVSWYKGPLTTVDDGVVELAGTTSNWNAYISSSKYDIGYYDGTTSYVWSFDYKSTADCVIVPVIDSTAATVESSSWTRTKYTSWQANLTAPSTSGEWKRLVFDPRTISIEQLTSGSGSAVSGYLQIYARTNDVTISVRRMKLEKGNTATDWSPAPEDVDSAISDAAKTATSYVTDINSNGITIHPSRSDYATNGGRAVINGDGLTIYLGSDDVASYGASARIGKSNSDRVTVDSTNGITIYKGNGKRLQTTANGIDVYGSDGTTSIASFGSTMRIGKSNGTRVTVDGNEVTIIPNNQTKYALTLGAEEDGGLSYSFIKYGRGLAIGSRITLEGMDSPVEIYGGTWIKTGGLTVGETVDGGAVAISDNGQVNATGGIFANLGEDGTGAYTTAGLLGSGSYFYLRGGEGNSATDNKWRFSKSSALLQYYDEDNSKWVSPMVSNLDAVSATVLSGTTISAGGLQTGTTSITKSGWTPIAISGWTANTRYAVPVRMYLSARNNGTGTISWGVYNPSSNSQTPTVNAVVLWARS